MIITNLLPLTMLCLGDSYTIGEAVQPEDRFSYQAVELLKQDNITFTTPEIIAQTGWTTDELSNAVAQRNLSGKYDFVTLLIGVNNQYRGRDTENYKKEFTELLHTALQYANGDKNRVVVISIPDWGATPFVAQDARKRTREQIANEIDTYNNTQKEVCQKEGIAFIDITTESRNAKDDRSLIAEDGLHPSASMYKGWAIKLAEQIKHTLNY